MAYISHWRRAARPIIARILAETKGLPEREIRGALRQAYPFGSKEHWPYKVWLNEIARQQLRYTPNPQDAARRRRWEYDHMSAVDADRIRDYELATGFHFPRPEDKTYAGYRPGPYRTIDRREERVQIPVLPFGGDAVPDS